WSCSRWWRACLAIRMPTSPPAGWTDVDACCRRRGAWVLPRGRRAGASVLVAAGTLEGDDRARPGRLCAAVDRACLHLPALRQWRACVDVAQRLGRPVPGRAVAAPGIGLGAVRSSA